MKIELLIDPIPHPMLTLKAGDVLTVADDLGQRLIDGGYAREADAELIPEQA